MARTKTYDSKCYDLAAAFLENHIEPLPVRMAQELAYEIQRTIEDYLEGLGYGADEAEAAKEGS